MREHFPIRVCEDCYLTHHGYDEHELGYTPDREPWGLLAGDDEVVDVSSGWVGDDLDDEDYAGDDDGFSWSPCDGCGSRLGGNRYRMTIWTV